MEGASDMDSVVNTLGAYLGQGVARIIVAVLVLIIGWLIARFVAGLIGKLLVRLGVDKRMNKATEGTGTSVTISKVVSHIVFWFLMLIVLAQFFLVLNLSVISALFTSFLNSVVAYLPFLAAAAVLVIVAWLVATVLRLLVSKGLHAVGVDKRASDGAGLQEGQVPLSKTVGEAVYWLVWLFFLPAILGALRLTSLMVPVQNLVSAILLYLPHLVAAALIVLVGWFVARIVQRIVTNLLRALGTDRLGERMGMAQVLGKQTLSGLIGLVVYILILVPVLIAALDALQIASLTTPLSNMLSTMLAALPRIFAAALALVIAYVVARLVAKLVTTLLTGIGFNSIPSRLGIGSAPAEGQRTASEIVGWVVLVAIMVFAVLGAASLLGWTALTLLLSEFVVFAWHIIVGLIVFGLGLWLADVIAKMVMETNVDQKRLVAMLARVAIVALALAIALRQMGLANEIINLAFGLLLGAIAVAVAIAFGIGGRDLAKYQLDKWYKAVNETPEVPAALAEPTAEEPKQ
jgi:hypothetical protein